MKYALVFLLPFLLLLLYGGCSSNGSSDNLDCVPNEEIVNSECLAEDWINVCDPFFCGATFPPDDNGMQLAADFFIPPEDRECISIDCNTLDCGPSGFFSDIEVGVNGMPTGLISSDPEVQFFCF